MRTFWSRISAYSSDVKLYLAYTLLANVAIGVFSLVFNLYLLELGFNEDFIGLFNAINTLAMAGSAVMLGVLINRHGLWGVVTGGLIAYLVSATLLSIFTHPVSILILSVIVGAASAMIFTPVMPFVAELTRRPRERQEVAAITMSLVSASTTIGSLVGGWTPALLESLLGFDHPGESAFRGALLVGIAIAALGVLPLLWMSSARKRHRPSDSSESEESQHAISATPTVLRKRMYVYIAVGAIMALGGGAVFPFYNVYLTSIGASPGQIGIVFAVAWMVAAIVGLGAPWISSRLGSQLGASIIRLLPVPLFLILIPFPILSIAVVAHLLRVASISVSWPMESSFISEILPSKMRNAVFGYRSAAWNLMFSLSSLIGGGVIVRYGYAPTFVLYVIGMVVAMGLYFGYFRGLADPSFTEPEEVIAMRREVPTPEQIPEPQAQRSLQLEPGRGRPLIIGGPERPIDESDDPEVVFEEVGEP